jgi:hypothetical protein
LTLAVLVLLANISSGRDFIAEILAEKSFNPLDNFDDIQEKLNGSHSTEGSMYWDETEENK